MDPVYKIFNCFNTDLGEGGRTKYSLLVTSPTSGGDAWRVLPLCDDTILDLVNP